MTIIVLLMYFIGMAADLRPMDFLVFFWADFWIIAIYQIIKRTNL